MGRYCDGDPTAFRTLYERVSPALLNYLTRMASSRALAEDVLQVAFLKIHRARSAYVRGANPLPWMYAIAHRTFLDEVRKRKRSKVQLSRSESLPEPRAAVDGRAEADAEPRFDPELTRAVVAALDTLPPKQKQAVVLTKLEGKSVAEAARIAGTTTGAMKVRAHRGYVALRKQLDGGER